MSKKLTTFTHLTSACNAAKTYILGIIGQLAKTTADSIEELAERKANKDHTHTASEVGALTNIKIGTVTTGAAGSSAAASASTSGTETTLNLTIPKGDTGATGAQGVKGDTGAAAGFGTPTASVDANVGTPSVTVTASGSNTAKVFNFAFKNLKGAKGDKGDKGDTGAAGINATTTAAATQSTNGLMSANDKKKLDGIAASANNYSLPLATASARGGVKIGYTANGKNYPVQLSNEQMYVNVPWTDTNTTYNLATISANGLLSAHDKTWIDGKFRRYIYGSDTKDTTHNGYYKICSVTTTTTYRTYSVTLRIASDNFANFAATPLEITIVFKTNAANTVPTVYVYSDRPVTNNLSALWNYLYAKYNSTAPAGGGTFTLYFNKTAAYQKITVDVINETQRGSTASTSNYQTVWTFDTSNTFVASVAETGFQVVKLNTLFQDYTVGSNVQPIYLSKGSPVVVNGLTSNFVTTSYLNGNKGINVIINSTAAPNNFVMLDKLNSTNGYFIDGVWKDKRLFMYTEKSVVDAESNSVTYAVTLLDEAGNSAFPGTVSVNKLKLTDGITSWNVMQLFDDGDTANNGGNLVIQGGGNTYIGSGEAPYNLYNAHIAGTLASGEGFNKGGEQTYIAADTHIYFETNCQTIADRKVFFLSNAGAFAPAVNNGGNLGTSALKWNNAYITTVHGALDGNAGTATKLATARTINGTSFDGSANITTANWGTTRNIAIAGDAVGNANINGSANASISVIRRGCIVGQNGSTTANPYYKFASVSCGVNADAHITFEVTWGYGDLTTKKGILSAHVRTNSSGYWQSSELVWESAVSGIDVSKFKLAHNASANPTIVELWCVVDIAYVQVHFDVIAEGGRTTRSNTWTLYDAVSAGSAANTTSGYTVQNSTLATIKNPTQGNAATATKATQDSAGQQINTTYIKALSVSGTTITYTKGDNTTGTITTQDTNTTYAAMTGATASADGKAGLVPAPTKGNQTKYLRADGTWQTPPDTDTTYSAATASATGLVSTGAQTFAGAKTFNGSIYANGATAAATAQCRNISVGTAAATTTLCASGALYGQYS